MNFRKILGGMLVASIFIILLMMSILKYGIVITAIAWGIAIVMTAIIVLGVILLLS